MEKRLLITFLFDFYSQLLTDKQKNIFEMYYFNDLSLNEIAKDLKITKQGVRDSLVKTEHILTDYENKLKLFEKHQKRSEIIDSVLSQKNIFDEKTFEFLEAKLTEIINYD